MEPNPFHGMDWIEICKFDLELDVFGKNLNLGFGIWINLEVVNLFGLFGMGFPNILL